MRSCLFIFGFGYTAKALASVLISQNFQIIGTSRSQAKQENNSNGVTLIDFDNSNIEDYLNQSTHLLLSIPPVGTSNDIVLTTYGEMIKKHATHLQWLGYLSSTGVYGDHQGHWVDEDSECVPDYSTGIARLNAEQAWMSFAKEHQLPLHIFRLSGIYGPERNALQRLVQGKKHSIFKEKHFFNRIHVTDIVATLIASIQNPNPLSVYNVSDDEPTPGYVIDNYAASLLNQEPPNLISLSQAELSPREQEYYLNNRRVSNLKIKEELNVLLKYPTYREGLSEIWNNDFRTEEKE